MYDIYGDGVANIDISEQISFHRSHGKLATVTAVKPPGRFGTLQLNENKVVGFSEKLKGDGASINGGFFVLSPKCIDYISNDNSIWEREPLENLAKNGELQCFTHDGYWQAMDTLREKNILEKLWTERNAPWKVWK